MRFTSALQMPIFWKRMKASSWQRWRKRTILDLDTEKKLREAGIPVVDANQFVQENDSPLYPRDWRTLPDPEPVFPVVPKNDRNHPDWHEVPRMVFDNDTFPIEGVKQAQAFSKSVQVKKGLPESIIEKSNSLDLKNADELAQRVTKQAFMWDSYLEKLPKLRDFDYPGFIFRTQFGIPAKRSNEILMRNFIRLIESEVPDIARTRVLTAEEEYRVNLQRHDSQVQFKLTPITNILSKKALSPVLNQERISDTRELVVPDIFPFQSTANIEDTNVYKEDDYFAFKQESPFPYLHTAVFSHHIPGSHTHIHPRWNDNRFSGTTIMYGFSTALLMARRKFGNDLKQLPHPVTSQVIHLTGKEFQFAVFQLNTLDLEESSQSSVKNVVWLTEKMQLFSNVENKLGKEIFEGYNPEVFKTLAGMYCS